MNKTTLLDYPGCVAATIFTGGCNFRCPFCHNRGLVLGASGEDPIPEEKVLGFLRKRKNLLKGICITGGEPTLQEDLPEFLQKVREMGYRVKLDTNGYRPEVLSQLLEKGLLDYVAMDIKNSPDKYAVTAGMPAMHQCLPAATPACCQGFDLGKIKESIGILASGAIEYEFRTTVVKELHSLADIVRIGEWIKGAPAYYLQKFQDKGSNIAEGYHEPDDGMLAEMVQALSEIRELKGKVHLRGVELL